MEARVDSVGRVHVVALIRGGGGNVMNCIKQKQK